MWYLVGGLALKPTRWWKVRSRNKIASSQGHWW